MNTGNWSAVMPWPIIGIHAALLPDGRVLTFGSDQRGEQGGHKIYDIWDPKTGVHLTATDAIATDEFCSAEILDPITGNMIITGGDGRPLGNVNKGVPDVNTFDYRSGDLTTSATGHLNFPRWYGSLISLGGGRLLEIGGKNDQGGGSGTPEVYTPGTGWTALPAAYSADIAAHWFYPRVWMSSNGAIFGFSTDNSATVFTINTTGRGSVTNLGYTPFETESGDPSAMFAQDKILTIDKNGNSWIMDISGATPTFTQTGNVGSNRAWSNLTDLADGTVLLTGGSNGVGPSGLGNVATETNNAEIWNPATNQWTNGSSAAIGRFYHSNTLLLPDGTVLSTGGGAPGPLTNLNAEIYTPGYLLNADGSLRTDRPVIASAPTMLQQGQTFTITLDNADVIQKLELIKFGNGTHSFDGEQRTFSLAFTHVDANTLQVTIPANANMITDGYWLLFADNTNGTPSVAATIKIGQVGVDTSVPNIGTNLMLNGTASHTYGSNEFTLTTDNRQQVGSVMSDKRIDLTHDFDLSFDVLMGNKANAADGMAFVLHNDPLGNGALGGRAGGLGAAGLLNGLAIQFDTWQNVNQGDITANHTDFVTTDPRATTYRLGGQVALNNLTDGNWHNVHVYWSAATHTIMYTFDGKQVGQLSQDLANTYFGGSNYVYFGFTGATGGSSDLHQIQLNSLNATFESGSPPGSPRAHDGSIFDVAAIDQHVTVNGSASFEPSSNVFTLTPNAQGQAGSVAFNDKVDLTHDFNMAFDIYFGPKQAADGMAFMLHNDPNGATAIGGAGGSLGAIGLQNGLAIEFDTQQNGAPFNDPAYNHTDIINTAAGPGGDLTPATNLGNIVDGGWHQVGVTWDSQAHTLRYWVDGKLGGTLTGDIASQYLGGQTTAYVAFTGATGGATATDVQQVRVAAVDAYFAGSSNGYANVQDPIALSDNALINGSATYDSALHTFVLTPDAAGKAGSAMLNQRIDLSSDFQASFDVYLGNNAKGADGLAFVLQNDPHGATAIGGAGGSLGAMGLQNGLGVAFDTWQNANVGDMAGDHTDFFNTGAPLATSRISGQFPIGNGNVKDGQWHNVLVSWNATDHTLTYWFDGKQAGSLNQDIVTKYEGGSQYAYLGFTAGTGGAHNLQAVHLNSLTGTFTAKGNNIYVVDNAGDVVNETGGDGIDTVQSSISFSLADPVHAIGSIENLTLTGTGAINGTGNDLDNVLIGNSANNILTGLGGNDTLNGGAGADTMFGGTGNDTYVVDNAGDVVNETGGDGIDTVQSSISFSLADPVHAIGSIENLTLTGTGAINGTGNDLDNVLIGNSANNILTGLGGNDTLNGGAGADTMFGGTGNDTYVVDNAGDVVNETGGDGIDTVQSSISFSLADPVHAIGSIENLTLTGTGAINATGNDLDNILTGNSANNILAGLGGADTLDGGAGVNTASYAASGSGVTVSLMLGTGSGGDAQGDTLIHIQNLTGSNFDDTLEGDSGNNVLAGGLGTDTVSYAHAASGAGGVGVTVNLATTTAQNTVTAGSDTLSGFENVTGSEFNDTLTGTGTANVLTGLGGNDTLNGGAGADTMFGGTGNDTYVVDNAGDVVNETGGNGIDTVQSSISFSLADPVHAIGSIENLTLTGTGAINATGNALDNILIGNSGANILTGGGGADILNGGGGKDTFVFHTPAEGGATIQGFVVQDDTIQISASGFGGGLGAGQQLVDGVTFVASTAPTAPTASGTFLYNTDSHDLLWDPDGSGAGGTVLIAHLNSAVALKANDFNIVA